MGNYLGGRHFDENGSRDHAKRETPKLFSLGAKIVSIQAARNFQAVINQMTLLARLIQTFINQMIELARRVQLALGLPSRPGSDMELVAAVAPNPLLIDLVFEKVFGYLDDPDLIACMSTCATWQDYLLQRRTQLMFEKALPFVMKYMAKDDFLRARLVSRKWDNGLTSVYENHPSRVSQTGFIWFKNLYNLNQVSVEDPTIDQTLETRGKYCYDDGIKLEGGMEEFQSFLEKMNNHPGTPFFGRRVSVLLTNIWYLFLHFDDEQNPDVDEDHVAFRLKDFLCFTPNLKWFQLRIEEFQCFMRMKEILQEVSFPKLEKLETFVCPNGNQEEIQMSGLDLLVNFLVKCCCSLESLKWLIIPHLIYLEFVPLPILEKFWCTAPNVVLDLVEATSPNLNLKECLIRPMLQYKFRGNKLEKEPESKSKLCHSAKVLENVMKFLPKEDFLKCRLVCKDWNEGICHAFENQPGRASTNNGYIWFPNEYNHVQEYFSHPTIPVNEDQGKLYYDEGLWFKEGEEGMQDFLDEMETCMDEMEKGNPFVGRRVNVWLYSSESYWSSFRRILEKVGEHIWYLYLNIDDRANENSKKDYIENRVKDCFLLVPNVRWLKLEMRGIEDSYEEMMTRLPIFFKRNPFPVLEKLEMFCSFDGEQERDAKVKRGGGGPDILCMNGIDVLINFLIKYSCNPRKLRRLFIPFITYYQATPRPMLERLVDTNASNSRGSCGGSVASFGSWRRSGFF